MKKHSNKEAYYKRLQELAKVEKGNVNENKTNGLGTLIDYKRGADNVAYGIIKENHHYYIKKSNKKTDPNVEDFAYIGGLGNITNYQYGKLSEAEKQRNLFLSSINEALSHKMSKTSSKKQLNESEKTNEDAEEEIEKATDAAEKLDTAVEKEKQEPEVDLDVDAVEVPDTDGEEKPDMDVDAEPDIDNKGEEPDVDVDVDDKGEEPDVDVDVDAGDAESEETKEIEKLVGKVTNKIRKTEMTSSEVKSFINSFLASFEDKLPELEIEDRKEMANKILKVVPDEDIENLDVDVDLDEKKGMCEECGFAHYVSERGYDSESLMECPPDEMASLMSGYLMDKEGDVPEEDYENMALLYGPEIEESLKEEYGHSDISEKMKPYTDKLNEVEDTDKKSKVDGMFWWMIDPQKKKSVNEEEDYDEEQDTGPDEYNEEEINSSEEFEEYAKTVLKKAHGEDFDPDKAEYMINGLTNMVKASEEEDWGTAVGILQQSLEESIDEFNLAGLKNVGKYAGDKVKGAAGKVGGAIKGAAGKVSSSINSKIDQAVQTLDQVGNEIAQEYQKGVKGSVESKLDKAAKEFGELINKLDAASQKAGEGPINKQQLIMKMQGALKGKSMKETFDAANIETQPNIGENDVEDLEGENGIDNTEDMKPTDIQPGFEPLGAGVVKPDGAETQSLDVEVNKDHGTVNVSMNENEKKLRKYIRARLQEKAGLRKPIINENKKSDKIKQLDKMIDNQYQLFENIIKESGDVNEILGLSAKEKFNTLSGPDDPKVSDVFKKVFKAILSNPQMGAIKRALPKTSTEKMYDILSQYVEKDGGTLRVDKTGELMYAPKETKEKATKTKFGAGGTGGKPAGGTTGA